MSPPPRRILYAIPSLGFGGAEVQVLELAIAMKHRGWEPTIMGLSPPGGLEKRADEFEIPHVHLGVEERVRSPRLLTGFVRECRRIRPDILHTHTYPPNIVGRFVRPLCRVPVMITSCHNVWEGGTARMALYRMSDHAADLTTNVSPTAVERYERIGAVPRGRIRYMANGIDTKRFAPDPERRDAKRAELGLDDDTFVWLAVGRQDVQKDYPNMLEAFRRVKSGNWKLFLVGDGPETEATEAGIRSAGLAERVTNLGRRSDVLELMQAADGYVMSSAWEGLPIVLLEAAASGLPIVATDVGGNKQIVEDGSTGMLVESKDSQALCDAVVKLMAMDSESRSALGLAARRHVEVGYGMSAVASRWERIYADLLAGGSGMVD